MKRICFVLLCMVVIVFEARAVTVFETFESDPASWTRSIQGTSTYAFNTAGYIDATFVRDAVNVDRYTTALDASYDKTQEYWSEMDMQMDSTSWFDTKTGSAGVFNSANNNKTNAMFTAFGFTSSGYQRRFDWTVFLSGSTTRNKVGTSTEPDAILRFKTHYWWAAAENKGYVRVDILDIPTNTIVGTTGDQYVVTATESVHYNVFGLANLCAAAANGNLIAKFDNMYFSTTSANMNPVDPSFVPEPATIMLLSIGGFFLNKRIRGK